MNDYIPCHICGILLETAIMGNRIDDIWYCGKCVVPVLKSKKEKTT
ncbi:MAG TPA: hypothetical protein VI727_04080 [Candidatus Brocadiaceae bacterium]|nr:hypothetical protein [Candidatus Brocadiaceae bacterium]